MEKIVNTILPSLEQIRKEIHKNPELSEHEYNTSKRIQSYLSLHTNGKVKAIAQTGVMVTFDSGIEGNSIMLRADTDALPIEEINTFDYKSNSFGISHK